MPPDPQKSPPDGTLRMPKVDAAMNKVAPNNVGGDRGDRKNVALGQEKKSQRDDAKILERARKRFDRVSQAEGDNRRAAVDDLKFMAGDQWPQDIIAQRNFDRRPCLTINKIPTFVHQVTNDLRQNRPTINVSPVGERGDIEVAKMYRGLIRAIERDSKADIAYDTGSFNAVANGFGYWRVMTEWEAPDSFNQVLVVRRIRNPMTVYLDPDRQEPDGSDAKWGFVSELIPRHEFEEQYPDADPIPWTATGYGEKLANWITQDTIRVAEYFEVDHKLRKLVALSTGHVGWEDELDASVKDKITRGEIDVLRERESAEEKITWYKLTAAEIIQDKPWLGKWIPIIQIIGDEIDIDGKVKLSGIVRNAKDPQRQLNYWETSYTELVALAPKAPFIMEEGQVEGHEAQWKQANTKSYPYLLYKNVNLGGTVAPPPQRQQFAGVPAGVQQALQNSAQNMMATTGIRFDSTMNERMIDESGKAIKELRRSGDMGSFHHADNLSRSLKHTGDILIDLIPKIYDQPRMLTILREDDSEELVKIDPNAAAPYAETRNPTDPNRKLKIFNPTYGKYGVTVTIGPSFATKRIEASESMMSFAKALPNSAALIADLIAKEQDWPHAEIIAARLAKALPPHLLTPDQKDVPPQIQALLQAMDMQIKQLGVERMQLIQALDEKISDRALRQDEIDKTFTSKMMAIEEKFSEALIKVSMKADEQIAASGKHIVTEFMDALKEENIRAERERQDTKHKQLTDNIVDLRDRIEEIAKVAKKPEEPKRE